MSDSSEIHSLLSDQQYESSLNEYTDSQVEYINDYNNGSYSSGNIFFDTQMLLNKWVVPKDMWLQIPLRISASTGTAYTEATRISFKQSILSLISGLIVSTNGSQTIVSDNNISIINNLRLLIENEYEWFVEQAAELMFDKDYISQSTSVVGGAAPTNASSNLGFENRIRLFKQGSAFSGGAFNVVANIPLQYIHDLFKKLDFPQINTRWQLTFQCSTGSTPQLNALLCDSAATIPEVPTVSIGSVTIGNQTYSSCRLYYKSVKFAPELNKRLVDKLNSGYQKKVFFRVTDTYPGTVGTTNANVNTLVSASTVHPLRVWLIGVPTTAYTAAGGAANCTATAIARFTAGNVLINNTNYYQNALNTPSEWWAVLSDQFPGSGGSSGRGGLLSYSDFLNGYRLHCFDVSRLKDRLSDPNAAVSIQLTAARDSSVATSCDYYYIVERLQAVNFAFTASETKLFIGL